MKQNNDILIFILSIFKFLSIGILMYCLFIILMGNFAPSFLTPNLNYKMGSYGHMYSRIQEVSKVTSPDLLVLGSSHAYRGVDPRVFKLQGLRLFNLGSSAQTPVQTNILLQRYLSKINPKQILYEVDPTIFDSDGIESALDIIANDKNDFASVKMLNQLKNIRVFNTLLYGFYCDWTGKNSSYEEPNEKDGNRYISGGFIESLTDNSYSPLKEAPREWSFRDKQLMAFESAIHQIKNAGIPLTLIQAPVTQLRFESFKEMDQFDQTMSSYATYYNFNQLMRLVDSIHFYDAHHLNQKGAELYSAELIKTLGLR